MKVKANDILSMTLRLNHGEEWNKGEVKSAIEYRTPQGIACSFYVTVLSDAVYQEPEFLESGALDTIKFKQDEDVWHVLFCFENKGKDFSADMIPGEMEKLIEQQQIQL